MTDSREQRYTLRLYRDNPSDLEVIEKMEELLSGKRFRNRNELFRRGIELAYAEYRGGEYQEQALGANGEYRMDAIAIREAVKVALHEAMEQNGFGAGRQKAEEESAHETQLPMTEQMSSFLSGLNNG